MGQLQSARGEIALMGQRPEPEPADDDPKPVPPEKPLATDCCESGCDRCVFDIYAEELEGYEAALAAWHGRHPHGGQA